MEFISIICLKSGKRNDDDDDDSDDDDDDDDDDGCGGVEGGGTGGGSGGSVGNENNAGDDGGDDYDEYAFSSVDPSLCNIRSLASLSQVKSSQVNTILLQTPIVNTKDKLTRKLWSL